MSETKGDSAMEAHRFLWQVQNLHERWEKTVAGLDLDSEGKRRPVPGINHLTWLLGHHNWGKDILLCECICGTSLRTTAWDVHFDWHSNKDDAEDMPSAKEIWQEIQDNHPALMAALEQVTLSDAPKKALGDFFTTQIGLLTHYARDTAYHLGQAAYLRQWLQAV